MQRGTENTEISGWRGETDIPVHYANKLNENLEQYIFNLGLAADNPSLPPEVPTIHKIILRFIRSKLWITGFISHDEKFW
jgi:hypothetical protein